MVVWLRNLTTNDERWTKIPVHCRWSVRNFESQHITWNLDWKFWRNELSFTERKGCHCRKVIVKHCRIYARIKFSSHQLDHKYKSPRRDWLDWIKQYISLKLLMFITLCSLSEQLTTLCTTAQWFENLTLLLQKNWS